MGGIKFKKKLLLSQMLSYFVPAFVIISLMVWGIYFYEKVLWLNNIDQNLKIHIERENIEINSYLRNVLSDLTYLNEKTQLLDLSSDSSEFFSQKLEQEYTIFISNHPVYQNIRFINTNGEEVVRVDKINNQAIICTKDNLQNKKDRYYFKESIILEKNEAYISPLDLNIEYGKIDIPFNPMLRFAAPVFDKNGNKRGIVVLNYEAHTFLSKLEDHLESGLPAHIQCQLLNSDGYWLHNINQDLCWGFMLDDRRNFQMPKTNPELWEIINSAEAGHISNKEGRYSFNTIHPINISQETTISSEVKLKFSMQETNYYWKIISFLPNNIIASYWQKIAKTAWILFLLLTIVSIFTSLLIANNNLQKKAAESKYKTLYEESREAIFILDNKDFINGNPAAVKLFGFKDEEELKQSNPIEISPEYQPDGQKSAIKIIKMLELTYEKGTNFFEWKHALKNGREFDATVLLNIIDINGKILLQAAVRDISAQKKAEKLIKQKQKNLITIFKSAPVGMLLVNEKTEVIYLNDAARKISDKKFPELLYKQPGIILCCVNKNKNPNGCGHSNECKLCPIRKAINKTFQSEKPVQLMETNSFVEINGQTKILWFEINTDLVQINDQNHVLIAINDITKRKETEIKLKKAKNESELLFRVVPSAIYTVDKERSITGYNKKCAEILGYNEDELLGQNCSIFSLDPCHETCRLYSSETSKSITTRECLIKHKDGTVLTILKNADLLKDENGNVIGGIESFEDITELKKAQKQAKDAIEMKAKFVSTASHELRTPLTAIKESINIVHSEMTGQINDEQKEFLGIAKENVDRLARLINDVLDFQKMSAGKMDFVMKPNNINDLVKQVALIMKPLTNEKGLYLNMELDDNIKCFNFDSDKIIQVLTNLINNSIKFTDQGGIKITTSIQNQTVITSIEDTGPGIQKKDIPRLFNEFEQLETTDSKRKTGGTGLGLAICKKIIENHNGNIWATSEFGKGTIFNFQLPMEEALCQKES